MGKKKRSLNSRLTFQKPTHLATMNRFRNRSNSEGHESDPLLGPPPGDTGDSKDTAAIGGPDTIALKKDITLVHAVGLIVGAVAGSGIFVSPTGVLREVGSVGASLVVWGAMGLLNLMLSLCYAELGSALPIAGGDYAYISHMLGRLPGFLCLWNTVILIGPMAAAIMGRTIAEYILTGLDKECNQFPVVLVAIFVNVSVAALNVVSLRWSARVITLLSLAKVIGMGVIVITGIVFLARGYTQNFSDPFAGTPTNPGVFIVGLLPGFVTYAGWDMVSSVGEEMKNPGRDLPLAAVISMLLVTGLYVMMNVAYFTVLTPSEFVSSNAVASVWAQRALPEAVWLVQACVIMACLGSDMGCFLGASRVAFSGGRKGQFPEILSHLHVDSLTPVAAIILNCVIGFIFCAMVLYDVQNLFQAVSVIVQAKIMLALIALVYLKIKHPQMHRTIKVPLVLVLFGILSLAVMICIAAYNDPWVSGVGLAIFLLGIPMFYLSLLIRRFTVCTSCSGSVTIFLQKLLKVVPPSR